MIRLWQTGADEFGGPTARALDDGSDWLAGPMQCFAGIALAGAIAASSLSAQIATRLPVDDIPPKSPIAIEDDSWRLGPTRIDAANAVPSPWQFEQHEQANGLRGVPDDSAGWNSGVAPTGWVYVIPQPWGFEQHEPPAPSSVALDETEWNSGVAPNAGWTFVIPQPSQFDQQEQTAGLYGVPEEDAPPVIVRPASSTFIAPVWANDDFAPAATPFVPDDDVGFSFAIQRPTSFLASPWNGAVDEVPTVAPPSIVADDDVALLQPTMPRTVVWPPWFGAVDELPTAAQLAMRDECDWIPPLPWRLAATPIVIVDPSDEIVTAAGVVVAEYPPGRFRLDDIQPHFALDDISSRFTLADIQPRFALADVSPRFTVDDPQATFTLRQDYPA